MMSPSSVTYGTRTVFPQEEQSEDMRMTSSSLSKLTSKPHSFLHTGQRVQLFLRYLANDHGLVPR